MAGEFCLAAASNAVGTLMVDYVVKPIERRIRYLFRFPKLVGHFRQQQNNLNREQTRVNEDVREAKLQIQTQVIEQDVKKWLSDAENALEDARSLDSRIDENKRCFRWCPNWSWRYRLSKEIEEKTEDISKLVEGSHFDRIGHRAELLVLELLPFEGIMVSKSSTAAFNKIMEALEDDEIKMIGVWGMGGVGKTTLVKQVGREVKGFGRVIFVTVSATPDNEKIQNKIADAIDLKFGKNTEEGKATELWSRLKDGKFLVILDDLWNEWNEDVDLKKIGIPLVENDKGCTIILTTRRRTVCESIKCQVTIPIDVLNGDEAWGLFRMKAELDEKVLSRDIVEEAKKVAEECKGLPVAIVTVASALKDTTTRKGWKLARKKLESSRLLEIGNIEEKEVENAYRCIKMSFDYLKKETTKRCFLLCSLYPEDHSIDVEGLVRYAWGLELYGLADSVEDVRIQVSEAIKYLKESCLLLEDEDDENKDVGRYVKLHDIVRDVALWITSKQENGFTIKTRLDGSFEPCKAISLLNNEEKKFPEKLAHSKLEMLLLYNCDVQVTCFQAMRELKVLKLILASQSSKIISLYALASLVKLRTLHLENFEDLSFLGNLGALEILTLRWSGLEGLAEELVRLENLKILDVTGCKISSMFPTNVIGRMFKLEELYLQGNSEGVFDDTIPDINSLSSLTVLSLQVSSFHFMEGFEFSKLERYNISAGRQGDVLTEKSWIIQNVIPLNVVSLLPESLESLEVSANADEFMECLIDKGLKLSNLKLLNVGNMRRISELPTQHVRVEGLVHLRIEYCSSLKFLFPLSLTESLVSLEILEIYCCGGLKQIVTELEGDEIEEKINSHHSVCFPKLRKVHIKKCRGLEYMFPMLMGLQGHQGLTLSISDCPRLKQVIKVYNDAMLQQLQFLVSLSSFSVRNCPLLSARLEAMEARLKNVRLSAFKGSFSRPIHLELRETTEDHNMVPDANEDGLNGLTSLKVMRCMNFDCLVDTTMGNGPTSALTALETLRIIESNGLETLCKGQPPNGFLKNLKELAVSYCFKLQVVFQKYDHPYNREKNQEKSLSNLQSLKLLDLLELRWIFKGSAHSYSLQSLKVVNIKSCNKLESLFSPSLIQSLVMLEQLKIEECDELKALFTESGNDGEIDANCSLPKLKTLFIRGCSKLECVVPITLAQGLPALESLQVSDCEELKQVFGMGNGQDGFEHHSEIESNSSLLPLCLPKLKTLNISSCSKLECVVPITLAQGLPAFESLNVSNCEELKQVFGMGNGQDGVEHDGEIESNTSSLPLYLPKLKTLDISFCSKLECVVPENYNVKAPVLESISAFCCPKVTNIPIQQASKQLRLATEELSLFKKLSYTTYNLSLYSVWDHKILVPEADLGHLDRLTSLHIGYCNGGCECLVDTSEAMKQGQPFLQNLKTLSVKHCDDMLEVFQIDEENQPQLLSNLEHLEFEKLYKLREIVKGVTHCVNLQSLKVLDITDCRELRWLFSVSVVQTLVSLEELKIVKCYKLKSVFTELDGTEPDTLCLPNLKTMEIEDCESLEYVFPLALAAAFPRLQKIRLVDLGSLRSVVAGNICLEAPALEIFHVRECSVFTEQVNKCVPLKELAYSNFGCVESSNMENSQLCRRSQNFEYITIGNCEQLLQLQGGYFISNLEKMFLGNLIWLRDIWKGSVHVATKLRNLEVYNCNSLTYIFPVMLIPHLPQLSSLEISSCEKLKQVIANDDILSSSSSSQCPQLEKRMRFPQFKKISITESPRLESFTHVGYHLEFPCLEYLTLEKCYKMMTSFTVDYLTFNVHAKTNQASQGDDASPSQQDIDWKRRRFSSLPQYVEEAEAEAEEISPLK